MFYIVSEEKIDTSSAWFPSMYVLRKRTWQSTTTKDEAESLLKRYQETERYARKSFHISKKSVCEKSIVLF